MSRIKALLFLLALPAQVPLASATVTYFVGTCVKTPFATIAQALEASPSPNVIKVCPGSYPEQVVITFPVTIEGISAGNATGATIAAPAGGLVINASDFAGLPVAAQVLIENASGDVNLNNLTVDGSNNNVTSCSPACPSVVGVFYQNSPGTATHLSVQNQRGNCFGVGIWAEGGTAHPSVTVESSNVQQSDNWGIVAEADIQGEEAEVTATIKGNYVSPGPPSECMGGSFSTPWGIYIGEEAIASVTGNLVTGGSEGIAAYYTASVSKNTVVGANVGIFEFSSSGYSVTSNAVYDGGASGTGIVAASPAAPVTGNTIVAFGNAMDYQCNSGNNVHSNTILGATNGLINVPTGTASVNVYYGVGMISSGGC
jgi:hypothetical protein